MSAKKDIIQLKKRIENIAEIQHQLLVHLGYEVIWKQPRESNILVAKKEKTNGMGNKYSKSA